MRCSAVGVEDLAGPRGAPDLLGQRQRGAAVAVGHAQQHRPRLLVERQRACPRSPRRARAALPRLSSPSGWNISTRARDRSAALSSKDGFSVVAPTSMTVPSSITGRKQSCWARLKRWISSTKSSVWRPLRAAQPRRLEHLLQVGDAGEDRRDLLEGEARSRRRAAARPSSCRCRAAPRRSSSRASRSAIMPRQRAVLAGQMLLADDLGERFGPQPVGERPAGRALLRFGRARRGRPSVAAASGACSWPSRSTVKRHQRVALRGDLLQLVGRVDLPRR